MQTKLNNNKTTKEQAVYLINKFYTYTWRNYHGRIVRIERTTLEAAKEFAKMCVDEIIEESKTHQVLDMRGLLIYWDNVKKEIDNYYNF